MNSNLDITTDCDYYRKYWGKYNIQPQQFEKFPDPSNFDSFNDFQKNIINWKIYTQKNINGITLPQSISCFYPRYDEISKTFYSNNQKIVLGAKNRLFLQTVMLTGAKIEEGDTFPDKVYGKYVRFICSQKKSWKTNQIYPEPNPDCFDSFEEFQREYLIWYKATSEIHDLPIHPSQVLGDITFYQRDKKEHEIFQYGNQEAFKYEDKEDDSENKIYISNKLFVEFRSFEPEYKNFLLEILQSNNIPNIVFKKIKDFITQLETYGDIGNEELLNLESFKANALAFLDDDQIININLSLSSDEIKMKFFFYFYQLNQNNSYSFIYQFVSMLPKVLELGFSKYINYLISNLSVYNQLAKMNNIFSFIRRNNYFDLINNALKKVNNVSPTIEKLFTSFVTYYLTFIMSNYITLFNTKSNVFYASKQQAESFISDFVKNIIAQEIETNISIDNVDLIVVLFILIINSGLPNVSKFLDAFKPNIVSLFNKISFLSPRYFRILQSSIIFNVKNIQLLFNYFLQYLKAVHVEELSKETLKFFCQFISIKSGILKNIKSTFVFDSFNLFFQNLFKVELMGLLYHRYVLLMINMNVTKKSSKASQIIENILSQFQKEIISNKVYLFKSFGSILLNFPLFLQSNRECVNLLISTLFSDNLQKHGWKLFSKLFINNPSTIMNVLNKPENKNRFVEAIKKINNESFIQIMILITNYLEKNVEMDSSSSDLDQYHGGFIFLISGIPNPLIEFAQFLNIADFRIYQKISEILSSKNYNMRFAHIYEDFRKTLNSRVACKQLFGNKFRKQLSNLK